MWLLESQKQLRLSTEGQATHARRRIVSQQAKFESTKTKDLWAAGWHCSTLTGCCSNISSTWQLPEQQKQPPLPLEADRQHSTTRS